MSQHNDEEIESFEPDDAVDNRQGLDEDLDVEGGVDVAEVGVGAAMGRERGELGLERLAGLDDLGHPAGVGAQHLDHLGRGRARGVEQDGAVAVADGEGDGEGVVNEWEAETEDGNGLSLNEIMPPYGKSPISSSCACSSSSLLGVSAPPAASP